MIHIDLWIVTIYIKIRTPSFNSSEMDIDERAFNWHFLTASLILSYSQFLFAHVIETYFFFNEWEPKVLTNICGVPKFRPPKYEIKQTKHKYPREQQRLIIYDFSIFRCCCGQRAQKALSSVGNLSKRMTLKLTLLSLESISYICWRSNLGDAHGTLFSLLFII